MEEFKKDPTWCKETYQRVSRETGLSESQVYKWGWDQKNKKNEDEDEDEDENGNEADHSQQQDESLEQTVKDDKLQKLDLAISQVKIDTHEMNHGILLPHEIKKRNLEKSQSDDDDNKKLQYNTDSTNHQGGYTTDKT